MISGFRKENLAQNDVANFVRNLENKLATGNFVWNCENKTLLAGVILPSKSSHKETQDAAERIAVAVNLRQHRRQQLLRGNEREWFLERGCRFCGRTLLQQNVVLETDRHD
jgi:hypothetical protein